MSRGDEAALVESSATSRSTATRGMSKVLDQVEKLYSELAAMDGGSVAMALYVDTEHGGRFNLRGDADGATLSLPVALGGGKEAESDSDVAALVVASSGPDVLPLLDVLKTMLVEGNADDKEKL